MSANCSGCGARLDDGATSCRLCGMPVDADVAAIEASHVVPEVSVSDDSATVADAAAAHGHAQPGGSVFCNQCGWENPEGSRFCAQCGAAIQVRAASPASSAKRTPAVVPAVLKTPSVAGPRAGAAPAEEGSVGKRVGSIFGIALLVVVALFVLFMMMDDSTPSTPAAMTQSATDAGFVAATSDTPLPAELQSFVDQARSEAEALGGDERLAKLRQIVDELANAGRFDKAAADQQLIAEQTNTEADWVRAGNLYYDWMDPRSGPERVTYAKAAIAAYRKALEINPDNLDVRTDLAVAYMSDPDNPMLAIQENAAVLAIDSLHVQANFNRGIMLLQINRIDAAIAQFEKVQRIVGNPDDPMYRLAEQALVSMASGGTGAPTN